MTKARAKEKVSKWCQLLFVASQACDTGDMVLTCVFVCVEIGGGMCDG
jgi:hypothetical protein